MWPSYLATSVLMCFSSLLWGNPANNRLMNCICKCQAWIKGHYVRSLFYLSVWFLTKETKLHCTVKFLIFTWIFNEQNSCRIMQLNEASLIKYWRRKSMGTELFALWLFHLLKYIRNNWWHLEHCEFNTCIREPICSPVCSHSWTGAGSENTFS